MPGLATRSPDQPGHEEGNEGGGLRQLGESARLHLRSRWAGAQEEHLR